MASQTVLEGLNSILDHRGEVFLSELGRTLGKAPGFRLFGCQNAKDQGNKGRKGLPLSFLNRFVRVYLEDIGIQDLKDIIMQITHKFLQNLDDIGTSFETILSQYSKFIDILLDALKKFKLSKSLFNIRFFLRCNKLFGILWRGSLDNKQERNHSQILSTAFWNIFETLIKPLLISKYAGAVDHIEHRLKNTIGDNLLLYRINSDDTLECYTKDGWSCRIKNFQASRVLFHNNFQLSNNIKQLFSIGSLCSAQNLPLLCKLFLGTNNNFITLC